MASIPGLLPAGPVSAEARARQLGDRLFATLRTAEALLLARRRIDLHGLEGQAADFCACLITLPPEQMQGLMPLLDSVLARLDRLQAVLIDGRPASLSTIRPPEDQIGGHGGGEAGGGPAGDR